MTMRPGVRLGVDVGSVRVGVASCDPAGMLATPLTTLARRWTAADLTSEQTLAQMSHHGLPIDRDADDIDDLVAMLPERNVLEIVVGLPRTLAGNEGFSAQIVRQYADELSRRAAPVVVRLVDERLTTVDAHRALRETGRSGRRLRHTVDKAAAALILQSALDYERSVGKPPGEALAQTRRKARKPRKSGTTGGQL